VGTGVGRTGTGMADRREQLCLLDPRLPADAPERQVFIVFQHKRFFTGQSPGLCDYLKYPRQLFRDRASTRVGAAADAADSGAAAAAAADSSIRIGNAD
jgi:hypothetical protein